MTTQGTEEDVRGRALDAAQATFDRALKLVSPPRHTIAEAFDAAAAVYANAEPTEAEQMLAASQARERLARWLWIDAGNPARQWDDDEASHERASEDFEVFYAKADAAAAAQAGNG